MNNLKAQASTTNKTLFPAYASMDFTGKAVVITGASSGIGREAALAFGARGAKIALVARNLENLKEVQGELRQKNCEAFPFACDVGKYAQVKKTCAEIKKKFGTIDALVNNAGFGVYRPFEEQEITEIEEMMQTNFFGTVYFTKELLSAMQGGSHIVNVSSMAGKLAFPNYSGYCASKFAVSAFTESLYQELMRKGVGVHLICPTGTKTHFFDNKSFDGHPHRVHFESMMEASEVARLIVEAVEKNRFETIPTIREKVALFLRANLPFVYRRVMQTRYVKRIIEKPGKTS